MSCERELGLMTSDRKVKNFAKKLPEYLKIVSETSFLPEKMSPSVECLVTEGIDCWPVSLGSYILARQSGMDVSFLLSNQLSQKRAQAYILPSIKGNMVIDKKSYSLLMDYVKQGSSVLITLDDGFLSPFESFSGVKVSSFKKAPAKRTVLMRDSQHSIEIESEYELIPTTAEILAKNDLGPFCSEISMGRVGFIRMLIPLKSIVPLLLRFFQTKIVLILLYIKNFQKF